MEHLLFIIWLLFYFPLMNLCNYISYLSSGKNNHNYSEGVKAIAELIHIIFYLYVANKIY